MSLLPFKNQKSGSLICHLRKDIQGIVCALKTYFSELWIKKYHGKSDPVKKAHDFSNVEEAWKTVDLVTYTTLLKMIYFLIYIFSISECITIPYKSPTRTFCYALQPCYLGL
jgi:hypothetical protein